MNVDVAVIGAGAAGLMCAIEAGRRGKSVVVLEHNDRILKKIRISGGGRCNFTNNSVEPSNYLSENPSFCISALSRFTPADVKDMVGRHGIAYYEKEAGQLFCRESAEQIVSMLSDECRAAHVTTMLRTKILDVGRDSVFHVRLDGDMVEAAGLVIASGGLSVPSLGASDIGYRIASTFGLRVVPPRPGLVPLCWKDEDAAHFADLTGVSFDATLTTGDVSFTGKALLTQRGLSGPALLQISSYWRGGREVTIDLLPSLDLPSLLKANHQKKITVSQLLEGCVPRRLLKRICDLNGFDRPLCEHPASTLARIDTAFRRWQFIPAGTEGFGKAEVTCGGIDTRELSSQSMEARNIPGLYCIGEVVDVTGWLGGYNAHGAWSSGYAAGLHV